MPAFGEGFDGRCIHQEIGWYVVGLTDGEGCFYIGKEQCSFIIKLRDDDRPLLEWVQAELGGVGSLRAEVARRDNPQVRWEVSRRAETLWLTEFFDVFTPRSKKARDYAIWREAVIARFIGMPRNGLAEYKQQLQAVRTYPGAKAEAV